MSVELITDQLRIALATAGLIGMIAYFHWIHHRRKFRTVADSLPPTRLLALGYGPMACRTLYVGQFDDRCFWVGVLALTHKHKISIDGVIGEDDTITLQRLTTNLDNLTKDETALMKALFARSDTFIVSKDSLDSVSLSSEAVRTTLQDAIIGKYLDRHRHRLFKGSAVALSVLFLAMLTPRIDELLTAVVAIVLLGLAATLATYSATLYGGRVTVHGDGAVRLLLACIFAAAGAYLIAESPLRFALPLTAIGVAIVLAAAAFAFILQKLPRDRLTLIRSIKELHTFLAEKAELSRENGDAVTEVGYAAPYIMALDLEDLWKEQLERNPDLAKVVRWSGLRPN